MALVDVAELLSDPDFVDSISIIARTATVDDGGLNVLTEQSFCTVGSIQPTSGRELQRLPEALRIADVSTFWVRGKITADGSSKYPDIIVWKGQRYAVQLVLDWTNWGAGWSQGICVREKPSL